MDGPDDTVVYNLATQVHPGPDARPGASRTSVAMFAAAAHRGCPRSPRLGAGIGGLEWPDVAEELDAASAADLLVVERPLTVTRSHVTTEDHRQHHLKNVEDRLWQARTTRSYAAER